MKKALATILRYSALLAIAIVSTSCWVKVENRIEPDEEVDERLIGIWKIVHQAPEEIEDPDLARYDEDLGIYEVLVIGRSNDGTIVATGVDRFRNDRAVLIGDFTVKTRKHKGKNFIVGDYISHEDDRKREEREADSFHFPMEYAFNGDGDLFLWAMHAGLFDEDYYDVPPLAHRVERNKFGAESTTVTASPEEILDFLVDPRVSPHLGNCGKYRKMVLPEGNSPPIEN